MGALSTPGGWCLLLCCCVLLAQLFIRYHTAAAMMMKRRYWQNRRQKQCAGDRPCGCVLLLLRTTAIVVVGSFEAQYGFCPGCWLNGDIYTIYLLCLLVSWYIPGLVFACVSARGTYQLSCVVSHLPWVTALLLAHGVNTPSSYVWQAVSPALLRNFSGVSPLL